MLMSRAKSRSSGNNLVNIVALIVVAALPSADAATAQAVRAENFGVSVGGNVSDSTIIIGVPQEKIDELVRERLRPHEELSASQREIISLLKEKLELNQRQIYAALEILGEAAIPPERLAAKLIEMAERLRELKQIASTYPGESLEVGTLKQKAQEAVSVGDFPLADSLLAQAEACQRQALHTTALSTSQTLGQRGQIALTRLLYLDAARLFGDAANLLPAGGEYDEKRSEYLLAQASAFYSEGIERGKREAADESVRVYRRLLDIVKDPIKRSETRLRLAQSLLTLHYRDGDIKHLREALDILAIAKVNTPDGSVLSIMVRQQRAITLVGIGIADKNEILISTAVEIYRSVLDENYIRDNRARLSETQGALGFALSALGSMRGDPRILRDAAQTMRLTISSLDPVSQAVDLSRANVFLGIILYGIGLRTKDAVAIVESLTCFQVALSLMPRERLPVEWATVNMAYAAALLEHGRGSGNTSNLTRSVDAVRAAHQIINASNSPADWAQSNHILGLSLFALGEITHNSWYFNEALIAFDAALAVRVDAPHSLDWKETENERERTRRMVEEASSSR